MPSSEQMHKFLQSLEIPVTMLIHFSASLGTEVFEECQKYLTPTSHSQEYAGSMLSAMDFIKTPVSSVSPAVFGGGLHSAEMTTVK
jgi:hypothetical protein